MGRKYTEEEISMILDTYMYLGYQEASKEPVELKEVIGKLSGVPEYGTGGTYQNEYRILEQAVQDEQIGHHVGSRRAPMCPGGEPDRAHEVSAHRHLAARAGVLRVHRVLRREHRDHPAGPGEPQALEDEMVVHRQPRRIVHRVVQGHV